MPTMSMSASWGKADIPDTPHQCPLMTQSRHFDFGSVVRYAALLGLRTAQEPDEIYSAYFNPKVVVKIKPTPASASTLWQVAAAAPLESSWNSRSSAAGREGAKVYCAIRLGPGMVCCVARLSPQQRFAREGFFLTTRVNNKLEPFQFVIGVSDTNTCCQTTSDEVRGL